MICRKFEKFPVQWIFALVIFFCHIGWAQQIINFAPVHAPNVEKILHIMHSTKKYPPENAALHILNMPVDSEDNPTVDLILQPARSVTADTEFVVVDEQGERPLRIDIGASYTGYVQGRPESVAFVSIAPDGTVRTIIHVDAETIINEYQPAIDSEVSATFSRALNFNHEFSHMPFRCSVTREQVQPRQLPPRDTFTKPIPLSFSKANNSIMQKMTNRRRSGIIVDTDYAFFEIFNNIEIAAKYASDLFNHVSQAYESEVSTRLNVKK